VRLVTISFHSALGKGFDGSHSFHGISYERSFLENLKQLAKVFEEFVQVRPLRLSFTIVIFGCYNAFLVVHIQRIPGKGKNSVCKSMPAAL